MVFVLSELLLTCFFLCLYVCTFTRLFLFLFDLDLQSIPLIAIQHWINSLILDFCSVCSMRLSSRWLVAGFPICRRVLIFLFFFNCFWQLYTCSINYTNTLFFFINALVYPYKVDSINTDRTILVYISCGWYATYRKPCYQSSRAKPHGTYATKI
jgi:hypothetical protein